MIGNVDVLLILSWVPMVVIVGIATFLVVACSIVEWDRYKAERIRRAAAARRKWSGMNRSDR